MADDPMSATSLQFGHGGEAVETRTRHVQQFQRGPLQFGHGGEAVETARGTLRRAKAKLLQFGHGGEAVETCVEDMSDG